MKILYIFPHPDDESFGPARAISAQVRAGHRVHLLTLTQGGATSERHRLGLTVEEMGETRLREMHDMANVLGLSDLTVLDLPDSGLKDLDPRAIEAVISEYVNAVRPSILVTYPVHGISGFPDHLVTHAAVKRLYCDARARRAFYLRRLAFFTLTEEQAAASTGTHRLSSSALSEIGCLQTVDDIDMDVFRKALDCYVTYQAMIDRTGIRTSMDRSVAFELFGESFDPPLQDLCDQLPEAPI